MWLVHIRKRQMRKLSVLVLVKRREPGLLSITDSTEKSFIPLIGGVRLIDLYLGPLSFFGIQGATVVMDDETTEARDYLLYKYNAQRIKVQNERDLGRSLGGLLKPRRNDSLLILRADGALIADWEGLIGEMSRLGDKNCAIVAAGGERIGYFLGRGEEAPTLIDHHSSSGADGVWDDLEEKLGAKTEPFTLDCRFFGLRTAYEYYAFQMVMMKEIEMFSSVLSSIPSVDIEKENLAQVEGTGFVKDSYISSSCLVEGYVENSVLFPHVRVSRNARVVSSVVMNNNYIGEGAVVQSTILCTGGQLGKVTPNVGAKARIGEDDSSGANYIHPKYIFNGITLIGENVEIPQGFRVARNCYIPTGTDRALFRGKDRIKAGDSMTDGHKSTVHK